MIIDRLDRIPRCLRSIKCGCTCIGFDCLIRACLQECLDDLGWHRNAATYAKQCTAILSVLEIQVRLGFNKHLGRFRLPYAGGRYQWGGFLAIRRTLVQVGAGCDMLFECLNKIPFTRCLEDIHIG